MAAVIKKRTTFMVLMIVFGALAFANILFAIFFKMDIENSRAIDEEKLSPPATMIVSAKVTDILYLGEYSGEHYSLAHVEEYSGGKGLGDYILLRSEEEDTHVFGDIVAEGYSGAYVRITNDDVYRHTMDISEWVDASIFEENPDYFEGVDDYTYSIVDLRTDTEPTMTTDEYMDPHISDPESFSRSVSRGVYRGIMSGLMGVCIFFAVAFGIPFIVFMILFIVFAAKVKKLMG